MREEIREWVVPGGSDDFDRITFKFFLQTISDKSEKYNRRGILLQISR